MARFKTLGAFALLTLCAFSAPANALTVGQFRHAYQVLRALDPMTTPQRLDYIAHHKSEIDVSNERLAAAELIRKTLFQLNGTLMEQGAPPVFCNYEMDDDDPGESLADWVDEFRTQSLERNNLLAGPESDAALDLVQMDEVITHKLLEEYACPTLTPPAPQTHAHHH